MQRTERHMHGKGLRLATAAGLALAAAALVATAAAAATVKPLAAKPLPKKPPVMKAAPKQVTAIQDELRKIKVKPPAFDFSRSPLPSPKLSALRFDIPKLPAKGLMKNVGNPFKGMQVAPVVAAPVIDIDAIIAKATPSMPAVTVPEMPSLPTVPPTTTAPPTAVTPPTGVAVPPTSGGSAPPQGQVNQANCAQFASMPGAQYCSSAGDPNGVALCQQCKAAGM